MPAKYVYRTSTDARREKFLAVGCPRWEAELLALAKDPDLGPPDSEAIRKALKAGVDPSLVVRIWG